MLKRSLIKPWHQRAARLGRRAKEIIGNQKSKAESLEKIASEANKPNHVKSIRTGLYALLISYLSLSSSIVIAQDLPKGTQSYESTKVTEIYPSNILYNISKSK